MFKSYFKVALRAFVRDRKYSLVNMLGLIIGLSSVFIIFAYVKYELSYDKYYSNSNRIYRIVASRTQNDGIAGENVMLPTPLGNTLQKEFPEIESITSLYKNDQEFIIDKEPVKLSGITVSNSFFTVFNLPLKYGNATDVFKNDFDVVISESVAGKYFHGQNPVGLQLIQPGYKGKPIYCTIKGVIRNIPGNTHFNADVIVAFNPRVQPLNWQGYSAVSQYILLNKNADITSFQHKISSIYKKYNFPKDVLLSFQPVTSIHLHSNISDEPFANSSIKYVYIFFFIAVFILIIGCINYINLTTARSLQRVKEIGVRKVIGAQQAQLALQFITESVLFFCITVPFALLVAYMVWPVFAGILQVQLSHSYLLNTDFILLMLLLTFVTGVLSGTYSAFFVSRLRPAHILKDWQKSFAINMRIRKALIVFQFTISVALIISTIIVNEQLHLLNNKELGFNKDHLIMLPWQKFSGKAAAFKNELKKNTNISGVTVASWSAGDRYGGMASMTDPEDTAKNWNYSLIFTDFDFIKTMQVKLVDGRDFSQNYAGDIFNLDSFFNSPANAKLTSDERINALSAKSIIITGEVASMIRLKGPATGKVLKYGGLSGTVIGEVKDFLGTSLLQKASPIVIEASPDYEMGNTYIKISPQNTGQTIDFIHSTWKKFFPSQVFDFSFVDDRLNHLYDSQQRMASIFNIFASLAIIIALLGLFSLVALTVQQKTKEIGIRKVLGAGIADIVQLLSKGYIKLIGIAALIATPIAWWAMNKWLQDFNYRVTIHWWLFIAISIACLLLALLSIIFQTIKVAKANPVESLRRE